MGSGLSRIVTTGDLAAFAAPADFAAPFGFGTPFERACFDFADVVVVEPAEVVPAVCFDFADIVGGAFLDLAEAVAAERLVAEVVSGGALDFAEVFVARVFVFAVLVVADGAFDFADTVDGGCFAAVVAAEGSFADFAAPAFDFGDDFVADFADDAFDAVDFDALAADVDFACFVGAFFALAIPPTLPACRRCRLLLGLEHAGFVLDDLAGDG